MEALLRFRAPDGTPVSPALFVPVAEEIGLIGRIGSWVLEQACTDAREWHAAHGISVTVNVSGRQLRNPRFADEVLATLGRTGLPAPPWSWRSPRRSWSRPPWRRRRR
ncbi:hypothetical protein GCM10007977_030930 [Dactylosporangium sucinum]|uniref:EAL domain-containing protein n=1 Tax=Dactylosporangium sucinum TaxID=1424081 RepID=A0A917TLB8_9ACTN|nr:hypothetical protein GCM10007977_030930 [Dactylosporangium sucinum]